MEIPINKSHRLRFQCIGFSLLFFPLYLYPKTWHLKPSNLVPGVLGFIYYATLLLQETYASRKDLRSSLLWGEAKERFSLLERYCDSVLDGKLLARPVA